MAERPPDIADGAGELPATMVDIGEVATADQVGGPARQIAGSSAADIAPIAAGSLRAGAAA